MKKLKSHYLILTFLLLSACAYSQQAPRAFSLEQAQTYAYENNAQLKNAFTDIEIAKKRVKENTAIGLPQVSAQIDYVDFLNIPTTLIPAIFGPEPDPTKTIPVKFGLEYNASVSGMITQLVYSGEYLVGLRTARAFLESAKQKFVQEKMGVRDQVAEAYIGYLILQESNVILDSTYTNIISILREAEASYKLGLIEDIDLDQLKLNKSNLESTIITTRNQKVIAYNFLKFLMGIKQEEDILLTDNLEYFLNAVNYDVLMHSPFDYNNNISYQVFKKQSYLVTMQYKLAKSSYQPSLIGFLSTSYDAQRQVWNLIDVDEPWYNTTNWGLTLNIPVWSSGSRKYKVDQARLQVKKMETADEQLKTSLKLEAETRKNDFNKAFLVFTNKREGLETAEKIYRVTTIKYRKGISSSTDLNQKYAQYMLAQSDYTQALLDLLRSRIKLKTLLETPTM